MSLQLNPGDAPATTTDTGTLVAAPSGILTIQMMTLKPRRIDITVTNTGSGYIDQIQLTNLSLPRRRYGLQQGPDEALSGDAGAFVLIGATNHIYGGAPYQIDPVAPGASFRIYCAACAENGLQLLLNSLAGTTYSISVAIS